MAWDRNERVEALLKEKIAIVVLERLSDPRLGFVTITGVKLSKDKKHAKVLFTVLGNASQRRTTERALKDAAPHVQRQVAPSMHMRSMPELRFTYDESIEKGGRTLDLLEELAAKRGDAPAAEADADDDGDVDDDDSEPVEAESAEADEPAADSDEIEDDEPRAP